MSGSAKDADEYVLSCKLIWSDGAVYKQKRTPYVKNKDCANNQSRQCDSIGDFLYQHPG